MSTQTSLEPFRFLGRDAEQKARGDTDPAAWTLLAPANFGDARTTAYSKATKWTGDSYQYSIYHSAGIFPAYAIRREHGAGVMWFILADRADSGESNLIAAIAAMPSEPQRWDCCHAITQTAEAVEAVTAADTAREYKDAFRDKRLKMGRGKDRGRVLVTAKN